MKVDATNYGIQREYDPPIGRRAPTVMSLEGERTWSVLAHLTTFLNIFTGFLGPVAAFVIWVVYRDDSPTVAAHAILLATGVAFRWLEAPGCPDLVGRGVYYGAATAEAGECRDQRLYLLGGGNSAGQAALLLADYARKVTIVAPEASLEDTMSQYLLERIAKQPEKS